MLELAASVWEVSLRTAARKLIDAGVTLPPAGVNADEIERHVLSIPTTRRKMRDLWENMRSYLPQAGSEVMWLRESMRLVSTMSPSRWKSGPGNLVGAYPHLEVEKVFVPLSVIDGRAVSRARAFKGKNWGDVLAIAFEDLPDRVCGFLMIGRACAEQDRVFRRVVHRVRTTEAGLGLLWAAHNAKSGFGGHVFACDDAFLATRLQVRHFASHNTPLPLVAYYDGINARTKNGWKAIGNKQPVLWGWRMTPSLVYQAIVSNGMIALAEIEDVSQSRIDHYIRNNEPRVLLRKLLAVARPWKQALSWWATKVNDGAIEDLLHGLSAYGIGSDVMTGCGPDVDTLLRRSTVPKRWSSGKYGDVVEKDGKWWLVRQKSAPLLLMNAYLRIDEAVPDVNSNGKKTAYRGRIIFEGREYPFELPTQDLRNDLPKTLQQVLTFNGATKPPLFVDVGNKPVILKAALAMNAYS